MMEKNVWKKKFNTKILIFKIYNTINQCDTILVLEGSRGLLARVLACSSRRREFDSR